MKRSAPASGGVAANVLQLDGLLEERLGVRETAVVGEAPRVCVKRDGAAGGGVAADVLEVDDLLESGSASAKRPLLARPRAYA